jgi:hypothetical protein
MKAWEKNPPSQWLTAAQVGYKAPTDFNDAVNNTLQFAAQLGLGPVDKNKLN